MKNLAKRMLAWAKKHTFHFVVAVVLGMLGLFQITQQAVLYNLGQEQDRDYRKLELKINDMTDSLSGELDRVNKNLVDALSHNNETINARIDTIDSVIDPELKRRKLIKSIRTAILENTHRNINIRTLNAIANAVIDYSYEYNLPIAMVLAQMKQESGFNVRAESHAQAKGLMQILDGRITSTADYIAGELGYRSYNIWDIKTNVRFGCYYMAKMLNEFENDYVDALRGYNFGYNGVVKVKSGILDFSLSRTVDVDGEEIQYLIDRRGRFIKDDDGNKIEVREEHRYPAETRDYVKRITEYRKDFESYGLDVVH